MKIHLLSGFLGSGKTTVIQQACNYLQKEEVKAAVITNDQGIRLVDSGFFEKLNIPNRQVSNGCFCCNYDHLENGIHSLMAVEQPEIIFAESVGSCTDIVATVMNPLLQFHPRTAVTLTALVDVRLLQMLLQPGTAAFNENVRYIFFKQLEEAPVILITKIDLIDEQSLQKIKQQVKKKYGNKTLLFQNSFDEDSIRKWLEVLNLDSSVFKPSSLQIDYDIYGEGERNLAWHDQEVEIYSTAENAAAEAVKIMNGIYGEINRQKLPVGHLKFLLNGQTKISFTATSGEEIINNLEVQNGAVATLLINARVETSPEMLSELIKDVLKERENRNDCKIIIKSTDSFRPGYPKPSHRLAS
jgi:G3E family GTPase